MILVVVVVIIIRNHEVLIVLGKMRRSHSVERKKQPLTRGSGRSSAEVAGATILGNQSKCREENASGSREHLGGRPRDARSWRGCSRSWIEVQHDIE